MLIAENIFKYTFGHFVFNFYPKMFTFAGDVSTVKLIL
jgi:hypothetical protein